MTLLRVSSPDFLEQSLEFLWGPRFGLNSVARLNSQVTHRYCRYISTGRGRGNAYGLAVACGVLFPPMMFGRIYWPGPPMTNILFFVTAMLVSTSIVLGRQVFTSLGHRLFLVQHAPRCSHDVPALGCRPCHCK